MDGIDDNQSSENRLGLTPSPDAIQEFNLITQNASAEFGNFQGGIVNTTIKSGTNNYHGNVFEFFRNDKFNANKWENGLRIGGLVDPTTTYNNGVLRKPALRWNMFGGTFGGPILKNKLFFFADYQGGRLDHPPAPGQITVLTPAQTRGDFGALLLLKDADGAWFTIHSGTLGLMVNVDALRGKPVPKGWKDLLNPQYRGLVGYLDPASAFVGYVGAVAVNQAFGGDLSNFDRAIKYFADLQKNQPIVPKQTSYARVLSGEIPILFDYDFNAYRGKYKDKANIAFVIPAEGTVIVPYVMSLVANAPHPNEAKKVLDHLLSDQGQAIWANAYLRPVRASAMSKEAESRFLPESEYKRARTVDYGKMAEAQKAFTERYLKETLLAPRARGGGLRRILAAADRAAHRSRRERARRHRHLRAGAHASVVLAQPYLDARAVRRRHTGDAHHLRHRRTLSFPQSLPRTGVAHGDAHLPARVSRRGGRLHGDPARRPPRPHRSDGAMAHR